MRNRKRQSLVDGTYKLKRWKQTQQQKGREVKTAVQCWRRWTQWAGGFESYIPLSVKVAQSCPTLEYVWPHGLYSLCNSPGQNTGVGSLSLLQGIFPTQGSNPGLPLCRRILYHLSHQASPRILEWGAYPFSSRSSQPRNQTGVFCIAGRFFTSWASREALGKCWLREDGDDV